MKKLLLATLILSSQFSYAHILANQDASLIVRAIKESLKTNDLTCYESVNGKTVKASELRLDILANFEFEITQGRQPILKFSQTKNNYETIVLVTTNEDNTVVTAIQTEQNQLEITRSERNTGTITNPQYDTITEVKKTLVEKLDCK